MVAGLLSTRLSHDSHARTRFRHRHMLRCRMVGQRRPALLLCRPCCRTSRGSLRWSFTPASLLGPGLTVPRFLARIPISIIRRKETYSPFWGTPLGHDSGRTWGRRATERHCTRPDRKCTLPCSTTPVVHRPNWRPFQAAILKGAGRNTDRTSARRPFVLPCSTAPVSDPRSWISCTAFRGCFRSGSSSTRSVQA